MQTKQYSPMMWRLHIGHYVINKLACGGMAFLVLNLINMATHDYISSSILSISLEQWVYGIIMMASITFDALCAIIAPLRGSKSIFVLSVWGYIVGYSLAVNDISTSWLSGLLGLGTILLFYFGSSIIRKYSLTSLVLAWIIPLVCIWIFKP
ncbi:hypothetical protein SAMN05421578_11487 [Paenibacillus macquariensis]|uniref:Uncharacterized protein n=3 Tax=Paenibacillus macquariensis TaxID=948756 RepID=A0ABY1K9A2_9BACL|nr:hypothetical protein SAMN05421578_11487 [Paenibacillus macquariensis]